MLDSSSTRAWDSEVLQVARGFVHIIYPLCSFTNVSNAGVFGRWYYVYLLVYESILVSSLQSAH